MNKNDNLKVRKWYIEKVSGIPDEIDHNLSLEDQARQAYELRNSYKQEARDCMKDKETAECLNKYRPKPDFERLVRSKMKRKAMSREEALEDIIKTASKTNDEVNKELGI